MDEIRDQLGSISTQAKYIDKKVKSMDENITKLKVKEKFIIFCTLYSSF